MSQVRKFSNGGGTAAQTEQKSPLAKTYGKFIINGKEITADEDFISQFRKAGSGGGGMQGAVYSDIADALQSGKTVTYNSDSNTISGVNFTHVDPKALAQARENQVWDTKAQRRTNRYARKNNTTHQFATALATLGNINFQKRSEETPESSESSKLSLFGSYNPFEYNTDAQGNTTFALSPWNATAKKYIDAYADLTKLSREQAKEKYDFDDEKYDQFINWYNTYGQDYNWSGEGDSLWSRIQSKNYNENDDELLKLLGWDITKKPETDPANPNEPRSYEGSGFNNDALEQAGYYVRKDSNGNPVLYDNNGQVVRDNIYLKDFAWALDSPWKNGAWYQGKFYTNDELFNQNNAANNAFQAYVNASTVRDENGNWNPDLYRQALNQTGWIYAGMNDPNPFTGYQDSNKTLLPGFEHITNPYYFQDISQEYTTPQGISIIRYLDPSDFNKDGSPKVKFAVSGNPDAIFDTQEQLQTYLSGLQTPITQVTGIRTPRETFQPTYEFDQKQKYLPSKISAKIQTDNGQIQNAVVYRGDDGAYYFKGQNGKFYQLYGRNIMNKILNGTPITQREFELGRDESDKMSLGRNIWTWAWLFGNPKVSKNTDWYNFNEYDKALGFKNGGKIPILQFGGNFSHVTNKINHGATSDDKIGTLHRVGGGPGLTDASDKWANAATALDTASLATSFIPGVGNVVGALTGLGGSVSRFISDIKRDGFDAGDLGRFGVNLGLDALTLIPIAGSAAKAAKLAKAGKATVKAAKSTTKVVKAVDKTNDILSSSDVLGNITGIGKFFKPGEKMRKVGRAAEIALPAVGTVSGINAAINAAKDGEITTDEMASIAAGIMSTALLGRGISRALDRKALKALQNKIGIKSNAPEYKATFKNKDGADVTVTLTADDLSSLKGKRKKALIETLESKVKNAGGDLEKTGIKAEDLLDRFKLPMKDGVISGINKNWNKLNIPKEKKLDVFSTEVLSNKELAKTLQGENLGYWGNRAARAYQYGLSRNTEALNTIQRLTGKTLIATPRTTFGGWGLQWDLSPTLKKATTRIGRHMISKMYHSGVKDLSSAKRYVATNLSPDKQSYWMNLLNTRGKEFDDLFKKLSTLTGDAAGRVRAIDAFKFKQGGKIVKAQPGTKMPFGTFVTDNSSTDPNLYDYQRSGIQFNGSNVDWTKTYGNGTFMDYRQQYLDNWDNPAFKAVRDAYLVQLSKGNNNVDLSKFTKDDFARLTQDQKLGYAHNLYIEPFAEYLNTIEPAIITAEAPKQRESLGLPEVTNPIQMPAPKAIVQNPSGLATHMGKGPEGQRLGETKQRRGINWDPDTFLGLGNLAYSIGRNNAMYGVLDDAIRKSGRALQKQMPTEIYDRYQDHITPIYQETADAKRQFTPTSTDAILNYTMRQINEDAAQQLLTEGRLKASEAYSQYLDKDLAARRMYADQRRQVADQNRAIMASTVMQLGQNDAARRLANNQSVQNYVMEFRNKLAQDKAKRDNLIQSYYTTKAQNDFNSAFRKYLSGNGNGKNYYQLFKDATDKAPNESFDDWLYRYDMDAYNKATEAGLAASGQTRWNGARSLLNWFDAPDYPGLVSSTPSEQQTFYYNEYKKGGKTSKYIQRHTGQKPDEAIWIQRNKDTAKALEKLHDAVIKLFMKTLS